MKTTEFFIFCAFSVCALICLAMRDLESFTASGLIASLVGVGIAIDREFINPHKRF
jgi:hypothetical protein